MSLTATAAAADEAIIGEVRRITVGDDWTSFSFANTYVDPVVFALSPGMAEHDPVVTRLRNVTAGGVDIRLQETSVILGVPNPGTHADEDLTLVVMERGVHILSDGRVIEVGTTELGGVALDGLTHVDLASELEQNAVVFSQIQTEAEAGFAIARTSGATNTGFELGIEEEEAANDGHAVETIGWMAMTPGYGTAGGMAIDAGVVGSGSSVFAAGLSTSFFSLPAGVMVQAADYFGALGGGLGDPMTTRVSDVFYDAVGGRYTIYGEKQEDASVDSIGFAWTESVAWAAFGAEGNLTAPPAVRVIEAGAVALGSAPLQITFDSPFLNPVVFAMVTTENGADAVIARITDVSATGFSMSLQEATGSDGWHAAETVTWVAVEAGSWLVGGRLVQAGSFTGTQDADGSDFSVAYDRAYGSDSAVFAQTQTTNDADFVRVRLTGDDANGFSGEIEEDEASNQTRDGHGAETIGWLSVETGITQDTDGAFLFEAGTTQAGGRYVHQGLSAPGLGLDYTGDPAVLAGLNSAAWSDEAGARVNAIGADGFEIRVEDDRSFDAETWHGTETLHWLALNTGAGATFDGIQLL